MTRTTWCLVGLGALVLFAVWSFRDYATLWRGRWQPLPLQPALSSEAAVGSKAGSGFMIRQILRWGPSRRGAGMGPDPVG